MAMAASAQAHALTLGDPQMLSFLSEPLQVHLPVSDWSERVSPQQFRLRLLPDEAYAAYGLSAPHHRPADLSVRWRQEGDAEPYVEIATQRPITEPILSLLLELRNNKQVLVRKIDLLLDLPSNQRTPVRPSSSMRAAAPQITRPSIRRVTQSYGPVRSGESLSRIAQRVRPDRSISLEQMAGALMQANPHAFFGDAHGLKAGVTLRIPDVSEIRASSRISDLLDERPTQSRPRQRASTAKGPPPFLPRAVYTRGRLWALSVEFLSYEAIRPVDLTPTLKALEAKEPVLFKADWTLSRTTPATTTATPPAKAPVAAHISTPEPVDTDDDSEATDKMPQAQTPQVQEQALRETPEEAPVTEPANPAVAATRQPAPQAEPETISDTATTAENPPQPESESAARPLWPWLLVAMAALGIWQWRRRASSPSTDGPQPTDANKLAAAVTPSQDQHITRQLRANARIQKRLMPALQSSDPDVQRQAQVAQAQLERGRTDQAQRMADELADRVASAPVVAKSTDTEPSANNTSYTAPSEPTDSQPSEFEQRRLRDKINKLRRKALSSDSQRQLKVAEAFFERGNLAQAHTILSGLKPSSDD